MDPKSASTPVTPDDPPRPSPGELRRAVVVAGHERDAATARAHLDNGDPTVRAAALGALQRAGHLEPGDLLEAMVDPHPGVRTRAAELATVMDLPPPDATQEHAAPLRNMENALLVLLTDSDDRVAEVAAFALGELPHPGDGNARTSMKLDPGNTYDADGVTGHSAEPADEVPPRIAALTEVATGHRDALCRETAVAALGALGHPAGLWAVLDACTDRSSVRRRAVLALAAFDGTDVTAMLEQLTADRDLQVSQAAVDLLAIETGEDI